MLNILVIGATGYVGEGATKEMYRAGNHEIFGLAATESEGYRLQRDEINPAVGSVKDAESVYTLIKNTISTSSSTRTASTTPRRKPLFSMASRPPAPAYSWSPHARDLRN